MESWSGHAAAWRHPDALHFKAIDSIIVIMENIELRVESFLIHDCNELPTSFFLWKLEVIKIKKLYTLRIYNIVESLTLSI